VVAPFVYTQLVTVTLLGWLVFGQFPDGWALLGMAIVVASGVFVATHQRRLGN
jgi:drug/metabolite transporter (DMT)-like permease